MTYSDRVGGERLSVVGVVTDDHIQHVAILVVGGSDWKEQPDSHVSIRVDRQSVRLVVC